MGKEFLYHYTTVESLAMILKTRSIKFSPLTILDDPQEERIREEQNLGKYIYVSSWTDDSRESIPMWKIYSDLECGVRIKLPKNPFKKYYINPSERTGMIGFFSIIPETETFEKEYTLTNRSDDSILIQVEYTNDDNTLKPKVIQHTEEGRVSIRLGDIGKHKKTCWSFQQEWRYRLMFLPVSIKEIFENPNVAGEIALDRIITKNIDLPFSCYFLTIDESIFSEMEVTLSPRISSGNRAIIEALKDKYNPKMLVINSELQEDIR